MVKKILDSPALTFDDVLLQPRYSNFLPCDAILTSQLSKHISLGVPIMAAAMDTVTESKLAISLALEGGMGIIHKNMSIQQQAQEVNTVKRHQSGVITKPITVAETATIDLVRQTSKKHKISALPILDANNKIVGLVTNRDLRYASDEKKLVSSIMTTFDKLVHVEKFISESQIRKLLHQHRIERVLIISKQRELLGMVTGVDIQKAKKHPYSSTDEKGRLRVGAAVGPDERDRTNELVSAGVDAVVIDTAHGHTKSVIEMTKWVRKTHKKVTIISGNIATAEAALALVKAGADVVKVGIGPGSICTTRVIAGVGIPQITAIMNAKKGLKGTNAGIIADGGIRNSGDIVKALSVGADAVMVGSLFAGTSEAPGEAESYQGKFYKNYRGMGSLGALASGSADRYFQIKESNNKLVPEGIEGRIPYKGDLKDILHQLTGGLRAGMGYCGSKTIKELYKNTTLIPISKAGLDESRVHDVLITKEAPNYNL